MTARTKTTACGGPDALSRLALSRLDFNRFALNRRRALLAIAGLGVTILGGGSPVSAEPSATSAAEPSPQFTHAWRNLVDGRPLVTGGVSLDIPRLAESGNSVSLKVAVDSPMTPAAHVLRIHLLSERNPIATIGRFHFSPRSGAAEVETSIRLATTQNVHAIAEMNDGSLRTAKAEVVVLIAACLDPG
jgi:sulfur-oxidizing protein SoxY